MFTYLLHIDKDTNIIITVIISITLLTIAIIQILFTTYIEAYNDKIAIIKLKTVSSGGLNVQSDLKNKSVEKLKKYSTMMNLDFYVVSLSLTCNLNTGAILRTAHLCGAKKYIIMGKRQFDVRSACGARKYMNIDRIFALKNESDNITKITQFVTPSERRICPQKFYNYMIEHNLVPIFLEQTKDAIYDDNIQWRVRELQLQPGNCFCFVFGNESDGISREIMDLGLKIPGSFIICIRQLGVLQSFNVSAAAAIILTNYQKYKTQQQLAKYNLSIY